jgi:hypothetical protein
MGRGREITFSLEHHGIRRVPDEALVLLEHFDTNVKLHFSGSIKFHSGVKVPDLRACFRGSTESAPNFLEASSTVERQMTG